MGRILVIDDDVAFAKIVVRTLRKNNYIAISKTDAYEGLEIAKQLKPDVILCDVVMPRMNGFELLFELQKDPETRNIPLIFITAKSSLTDRIEGIDLGADSYISKPIDCEELLSIVDAKFIDLGLRELRYKGLPSSQQSIGPSVDAKYASWWIAIEPDSKRCFLGRTRELAYRAAMRAFPAGVFIYHQINEGGQIVWAEDSALTV